MSTVIKTVAMPTPLMLKLCPAQSRPNRLRCPYMRALMRRVEEDTAMVPEAPAPLEIQSSPGPWEDLTDVLPKGLNLPMSPALYAKMLWITNNVPKMSLQKIAKAGAEAEADRLIALYYKPSPI